MPRVVQPLSRTSSATSVESSSSVRADAESIRRTRKRFTNSQLAVLEQLFQRNSHPSREERESVAHTGDMYVIVNKHVVGDIDHRVCSL
jgi:hypothetical protein